VIHIPCMLRSGYFNAWYIALHILKRFHTFQAHISLRALFFLYPLHFEMKGDRLVFHRCLQAQSSSCRIFAFSFTQSSFLKSSVLFYTFLFEIKRYSQITFPRYNAYIGHFPVKLYKKLKQQNLHWSSKLKADTTVFPNNNILFAKKVQQSSR
jgi:hypothetical protein